MEKADLVIFDALYIGSSPDDQAAEIATNMWLISLSAEECSRLTTEDLRVFLDTVVTNRQQQLGRAHADHGMIFYAWFDEQASQLRFNLISDYHDRLPFRCQLHVVATPDAIIDSFLGCQTNDGIPVPELTDVANKQISSDWNNPPQPYDLRSIAAICTRAHDGGTASSA